MFVNNGYRRAPVIFVQFYADFFNTPSELNHGQTRIDVRLRAQIRDVPDDVLVRRRQGSGRMEFFHQAIQPFIEIL